MEPEQKEENMNELDFFAREYRESRMHPRWEEYEEYVNASYEGAGSPKPLTFSEWLRWS